MLAAANSDSASGGVRIGASTYSFRDLPRVPGQDNIDDIIKALAFSGVSAIELASANAEPAGPDSGPAAPPKPSVYPPPVREVSPEEVAAAKKAVRDSLRDWRLATPSSHYENIRTKFSDAGIAIFAYSVNYDADFTDAEIEATFSQAKALGVDIIASAATLTTARRLAPFAAKHGILIALHNGIDIKNPDAVSTPRSLAQVLALSTNFRINLDIGNFTAANAPAVAWIQENHESITHVQLKDRTRNGGGNEPLGEGDTPVRQVLKLLQDRKYPIPAFVEYEYIGLGTPPEEVKNCMAYVRAALS